MQSSAFSLSLVVGALWRWLGKTGGITKFPQAIHGFRGRMLGNISEVNKQGIVLSNIAGVNKTYPPDEPGGLEVNRPVENERTRSLAQRKDRPTTLRQSCRQSRWRRVQEELPRRGGDLGQRSLVGEGRGPGDRRRPMDRRRSRFAWA